VLNDCCSQCI